MAHQVFENPVFGSGEIKHPSASISDLFDRVHLEVKDLQFGAGVTLSAADQHLYGEST